MVCLDTRNMKPKEVTRKTPSVKFTIGDVLKTTTSRKHKGEVIFDAFPPDRSLCMVTYIAEYLTHTKNLRDGATGFFLALRAHTDQSDGTPLQSGQNWD